MAINRVLVGIVWATPLLIAAILFSQPTLPMVDQPYGGDRNVTGQCVPNSAPLSVYDVSSGTKVYLGSGKSIDQQGYFAVAVNPPLVSGMNIVVVDSQGRSSATTTVTRKTGPAGGAY